jgi:hypothetical protein
MIIIEILLIAIIALLGLILPYKWKKLKKFQKKILSVLVLLTIVLAIVQIRNSRYEKAKEELIEKVNSSFGELEFDGEPVTTLILGNKEGSGSVIIKSPNGTPLNDKYGPLIRIGIKDEKLLVNIVVRDLNGEAIAVIDRDTWKVYDDDYEYNDDNGKAFELVTKGDRKVFFQIEYKNELVHVSGHLLNPEGGGVVIYYDKNGKLVVSDYTYASIINEIKNLNIPRLFKYPRGKYYGERL